MLSKFSRVLTNYSCRWNSASKATKFKLNCTNVTERQFHSNKYLWEKISPKPNSKTQKKPEDVSAQSVGLYSMAVVVLCGGLTFAAVPLYRLFCQVGGCLDSYKWNLYIEP